MSEQNKAKRMLEGKVVANNRQKTIKVSIQRTERHALYGKVMHTSTTLHVHDEKNSAKVGDTVRIVQSRPYSKTKSWELAEIVSSN